MNDKRKHSSRRGVVLLVVLALLALFALVAVAFVVVANVAHESAKAGLMYDQTRESPQQTCDQAFRALIRGSNNAASVIGSHSILEDMYGNLLADAYGPDACVGAISGSGSVCGGQLIELGVGSLNVPLGGCVITMLDGPAAGLSSVIAGVNPTNGAAQVLAFPGGVKPAGGNHYLINGAAFSGMGFGYNRATGNLDATNSFGLLALLPGAKENRMPAGGANSDYTAPDFQHPFLAAQIPGPGNTLATPIPSFHRPELIKYWMNQGSLSPALLRQIMLRPNSQDNPGFTGSNPSFDPIKGPWDVDSDGEGTKDSIWIDAGLPVRYSPDGRAYKVLIAPLIVDMDGRLNVNAHGSLANLGGPAAANPSAEMPAAVVSAIGGSGPQLASGTSLPRGLGAGPAEISLVPALGSSLASSLMVGTGGVMGRYGELNPAQAVPGAYGQDSCLSINKWYDYTPDYWSFAVSGTHSDAWGSPPDLQGNSAVGLDPGGRPLFMSMGGPINNNPYAMNLAQNAARGLSSYAPVDNPFGPAEWERVARVFDHDATTLPGRLLALGGGEVSSRLVTHRYALGPESWDAANANFAFPPAFRGPAFEKAMSDKRPRHITDLLVAKGIPSSAWCTTASNPYGLLPWDLLVGLKMNLNPPLALWKGSLAMYSTPSTVSNPSFNLDPKGGNFLPYDPNGGSGKSIWPPEIQARQQLARYLYVLLLLLRDESAPIQCYSEAGVQSYLDKRRLAQWAINAVTFQTNDSVMVPFKYDLDPLTTGWRLIDDNIRTNANDPNPSDIKTADSPDMFGVVWGCKPPEMLLMESAAWHNRGVADTDKDDGPKKRRVDSDGKDPPSPLDPDLDQVRVPQGSLFLEFYCPRTPSAAAAPTDLYKYINGQWKLDLTKLAPADKQGVVYPVWRVVISQSTKNPDNDVRARLQAKPDSSAIEPEQWGSDKVGSTDQVPASPPPKCFSLLPSSTDANVKIDRIIWFAPLKPVPGSHLDANRTYYNRNPSVFSQGFDGLLPGGQYLVVGPRKTTNVGSATASPSSATQTLTLSTTGVNYTKSDATSFNPAAGTIKQAMTMVVAGAPPASWTNASNTAPNGIGISISEPIFAADNYYPEPSFAVNGVMDWYCNMTSGTPPALDHPLESATRTSNDSEKRPIEKDNIIATGTTKNHKTAFLQRLANPSLAYDPVANPYRTVDWLPIDLTVFNGEDTKPKWPPDSMPTLSEFWDKDDPNYDPSKTPSNLYFGSRQRGNNSIADQSYQTSNRTNGAMNVWAQKVDGSDDPAKSTIDTAAVTFFPYDLQHTFGYLNAQFGAPLAGQAANSPYLGDPASPFPWITWNNRPYISPLELLLVPSSHPARLLWEYRFVTTNSPKPYTVPASWDDVAFPHLLGFFQSSPNGGNAPPQLHRLFEYVGVPPQFVGAEVQINPNNAGGSIFCPPMNRVSTYRMPGKINLNTIFSRDVYSGLMTNFPALNTDAAWTNFLQSRAGPGNSAPDLSQSPDAGVPTRFARPFRSFAGGQLAPLSSLRPDREIDSTLLRSDPNNADQPLFNFTSADPSNDTNRNAFFRYQGLSRLPNLVTTRSNVFAIWITIGYFQVSPSADADAHPDGWRLGPELGSDTGNVERHRAFYLYDRSIPVGFQRGRDLNLENGMLIRRFIE